jgi:transposase InsO family protein
MSHLRRISFVVHVKLKSKLVTHPKNNMMSTSKAFKLLHMDLFGPTTYTGIGGNKYGFMIVDDFTRYTWVFFLVDKSDVFITFKTFIKRIHNEFETIIKKVRSGNGSKFKNIRVDDLCDEFGIRHQFLAKYTPQSNGLVKRPKDHNVIRTKWIFQNKQDQDGIVIKARLVAQDYIQVVGLDFGETYAPVVRLEAIRILLA